MRTTRKVGRAAAAGNIASTRSGVPPRALTPSGVPSSVTHQAFGPLVWIGALSAGIALLVRLVYLAQTADVVFVRHPVGDGAGYVAWASAIAAGEWLGSEPFYQAPLYPYVLALISVVWGADVATIRLVQIIWGSLGVGCLAVGASLMMGRSVGIVAGIMLALYPAAIFFDGAIQKTSLACLLVCVLACVLACRCSLLACMATGIGGGLLCLTRENALAWLPLLGLWMWVRRGTAEGGMRNAELSIDDSASTIRRFAFRMRGGAGRRGYALGAYLLGVGFILVPVGVRNSLVGGAWSVSTFQAGPNFYIGNNREADGRYRPLVRGHETPDFEQADAAKLAEQALGRELGAREVSRYWLARALDDIVSDPLRWLALCGRKTLMVWNRYEVADVESLYVYMEYSPLLRVVGSIWHFGVLCPLAALGVWATWGERRRLWIYYALILSLAAAVALFFVLARYRFPLVPLLIPFAAAGCLWFWRNVRAGNLAGLGKPMMVAAVVGVIVNWPVHDEHRLNAMAYSNLGSALGAQGDLDGAIRYLSRATEGHPESAEAHFNLAYALSLQGNYPDAITHYRTALVLEPGLVNADFLLAVALERVDNADAALAHYRRALQLDPSNTETRDGVNRLEERNGAHRGTPLQRNRHEP